MRNDRLNDRELPLDERERMRMEEERRLTLSEEELALGKRQHAAGEVEIEKSVESRHVRESVPVRHEEVVVERRPAQPGMRAESQIREEHIEMPVTEEEVIAQKRVVPREEIVAHKREVVENQEVEADLRRERAIVHGEGRIAETDTDRDALR